MDMSSSPKKCLLVYILRLKTVSSGSMKVSGQVERFFIKYCGILSHTKKSEVIRAF